MKGGRKNKMSILTTAVIAATLMAPAPQAQMSNSNPMVGGMAMYANKNIVENAVNSPDHTTLVAAVKAAGLLSALQGKGPMTVFAPVNSAFDMLPAGTVDKLLMTENKPMLSKVLTYHVVGKKLTFDSISNDIKAGKGSAEYTTLSGGKLWAMWNGPRNIVIKDEMGGVASITTYDVMQSNGVIHVVNKVLMPK